MPVCSVEGVSVYRVSYLSTEQFASYLHGPKNHIIGQCCLLHFGLKHFMDWLRWFRLMSSNVNRNIHFLFEHFIVYLSLTVSKSDNMLLWFWGVQCSGLFLIPLSTRS